MSATTTLERTIGVTCSAASMVTQCSSSTATRTAQGSTAQRNQFVGRATPTSTRTGARRTATKFLRSTACPSLASLARRAALDVETSSTSAASAWLVMASTEGQASNCTAALGLCGIGRGSPTTAPVPLTIVLGSRQTLSTRTTTATTSPGRAMQPLDGTRLRRSVP